MVNNVCRNVLLEGGWGWGPNPYGKCHVFLVFLDYFPEQFTSGATSTSDGIFLARRFEADGDVEEAFR